MNTGDRRMIRSRSLGSCVAALMCLASGAMALPVVNQTGIFDAASLPAVADDPVAHSLRNILEMHRVRDLDLTADERTALTSFYGARDWQPVWTDGGLVSHAGHRVIARLRKAAQDGLDPASYGTPSLELGRMWPISAVEIAKAEIVISRSVLRYADHAQAGRIRPNSVSRSITLQPERPVPAEILASVSQAGDPGEALGRYNPDHPGFVALRAKLAELRADPAATAKAEIHIADGPTIKPLQRDGRVAALRHRLNVTIPTTDANLYDAEIRAAVVRFQSVNGLKPDGLVGRETLAVMNGDGPAADVEGILANMEMWRWMPRKLGPVHVQVNVPEFRLKIVHGTKSVHSTRVVVGKIKHKTPIFSDKMEHVVVNPYWNVPLSIARNEMLSAIRANPTGYLQSRGYEVLYGGRRVHPASISWDANTVARVNIRQRPGAGNALGRIKFLFPNKHAVYLHDTPSRHLFAKKVRAFSHGCVRVERPLEFADALLTADKTISGNQIRRLLGKKERWVNLDRHIPVHISYFTVWVDNSGALRTARDIYGHEKKVRALLRS